MSYWSHSTKQIALVERVRLLFSAVLSPQENQSMPGPLLFHVPSRFETPRLILRTFAVEDGPLLLDALTESIQALRTHLWFLPWVAEEPTLASATIRCQQALANYLQRTDLACLAFNKETMRLVGSAGLHRTDWTIPKTEVGYWLRSTETGKGYATEAVDALTAWALNSLKAKRVELVTDEHNVPSRAVALRCGFALDGVQHNTAIRPDGSMSNSCIYARLADAGK